MQTWIERDAGDDDDAVLAAADAYNLAWCDGPPFVYHWGLERARQTQLNWVRRFLSSHRLTRHAFRPCPIRNVVSISRPRWACSVNRQNVRRDCLP